MTTNEGRPQHISLLDVHNNQGKFFCASGAHRHSTEHAALSCSRCKKDSAIEAQRKALSAVRGTK